MSQHSSHTTSTTSGWLDQLLKRPSRLILILGALLIASLWTMLGMSLAIKHEDALGNTLRNNLNLTHLLEEQMQRILTTIEQAHQRLGDAYVDGALKSTDFDHITEQTGLSTSILLQLSLISNEGLFVGSNLDPMGARTGHIDLSDREHVKVHLATKGMADPHHPVGLYIGRPVLGKVSKRWTIQTSRPIVDSNGKLLGITVASLDPTYFESVYRGVSLGRYGSVSLVGQDLGIRVHVIGGTGAGFGQLEQNLKDLDTSKLGSWGHLRTVSQTDGMERLVAFRRVGTHPLYVVVTSSVDEVLGSWRSLRNRLAALASMLTMLIISATLWLHRRQVALEEAHEHTLDQFVQLSDRNLAFHQIIIRVCEQVRLPLSQLRGFAEQMEVLTEQPSLRDHALQTRKDIEGLHTLLVQLLDLSKAQTGVLPVSNEQVNLEPLLRSSVSLFSEPIQAKGIETQIILAPNLPTQIHCDPMRLRQILRILLGNALNHTSKGFIHIEASPTQEGIAISVVDSGAGVLDEQREIDFEHYRQGLFDQRTGTNPSEEGVGLGLALARALAQRMEGELTLDQSQEQGCRFTLTLPLTQMK